ncbi:PREDICTED: cysteine protease ATG4D isoform X1 [Bactrocera latifrons]|uniref:Cysteine protease n=2 Tax=Bactrocera latifrons TaxID=174628 RepID=A0A0K8V823_BACLA|nr:PREDICTED: cysteine protease ATG4D isoform X1 [Bactrocera latifrons]XP_018797160.1 PREDICTED: cysteine protease ATG4D isoform X1 [Bactrocera latifrons]
MMSYDGLLSLSQLTDEKLSLIQGSTTPPPPNASKSSDKTAASKGADRVVVPALVDVTVEEEEQAATIQTIQLPSVSSESNNATFIGNLSASTATATETTAPFNTSTDVLNGDISTPQRKISASSRFMNAFQQLYSSATTANTSTDGDEIDIANSTNGMPAVSRTPHKGMESKLLSMWHNVKYGWSGKIKPNFSKEQPVWLLGRCYHRKYTPPSSMESSTELTTNSGGVISTSINSSSYETPEQCMGDSHAVPVSNIYPPLNAHQVDEIVIPQELGMDAVENQVADHPWEEGIEGFRRDFYSRIWMTYRREFPTMNGSSYTSDCGWGCMLRSGQMLLAQGLVCHFLGRSWRYDAETQLHSTFEDNMHKKIIKWFGDSSSKSSPFSIHALVSLGEEMGKRPGDWYGPASVSYLLKQALKMAAQENADFDNITIYVAKDCTIYMQDVEKECRIREPSPQKHVPWQTTRRTELPKSLKQQWKSLILLIPLRLGSEKLNPVYAHCLKLLLSTEYCIGIIGGRPKHSLYFVGFQEDKLIHLDPHYCQEMVDVNQDNFSLQSFHCKSPRKLKTSKMDPSCCIGFYCATKIDFDNFVESVQLYLHPMRCTTGLMDKLTSSSHTGGHGEGAQYSEINYPLFTFSRGQCPEEEWYTINDSPYKPLQQQVTQMKQEFDLQTNSMSYINAPDDDDEETEEFVLL